jgi:ABC-type transporter MlaC component
MGKLKKGVCALVGLAALAGPVSVAEAGPDPMKAERFVREGVARSFILFKEKNPPRTAIARRVRSELNENFDIDTIAGYALGPLGRNLSTSQKQRYLSEFKEWVGETVTRFVIGLRKDMPEFSPDTIRLAGTTRVGTDQILVHSRIRQSDTGTADVDWRLRLKGDRFLVLDIIISGVSQAAIFKSQFEAIIRREKRDIEGLIADLKQKNAVLAQD